MNTNSLDSVNSPKKKGNAVLQDPLSHQLQLLGITELDPIAVGETKNRLRAQMSPPFGLRLKDEGLGGTIRALGYSVLMVGVSGLGLGLYLASPTILYVALLITTLTIIVLNQVDDLEASVAEWERIPLFVENYRLFSTEFLSRFGTFGIPKIIIETAHELTQRVPGIACYVDILATDPFLCIRYEGKDHYLAQWEHGILVAGLKNLRTKKER